MFVLYFDEPEDVCVSGHNFNYAITSQYLEWKCFGLH